MGSGKTHFGKKLATALQYDFYDLDSGIESEEKLTVAEIFQQKGEPYFRKLEKAILQKTAGLHHTVIATGGGSPCFFDNMDFILRTGFCIWVNTPVQVMQKRIAAAHGTRPLLQNLDAGELEASITSQLLARTPVYEKADLQYHTETISESDFIRFVVQKFTE